MGRDRESPKDGVDGQRRHRVEDAVQLWRSMPDLPGLHMHTPVRGIGRSQSITSDDDQVLATIRTSWLRRSAELESTLLGDQQVRRRRQGRSRLLVDTATEGSVVTITGGHFNFSAGTTAVLADGRTLTFPVWGNRLRNAVMHAMDSRSAQPVVRFRIDRARIGGRTRFVCDAVLEPNERLTRELAWVIRMAPGMMRQYFSKPGGGG